MKKTIFRFNVCMLLAFFLLSASVIEAKITLPKILGSNMVLQRHQPVKIWGWADAREKVTVTFNGQEATARTGKDGKWMVTLEPMNAGGPYEMIIKGKNKITLSNILIGEVWVCSGQSNMQWTVANSNNAEEEILAANFPEIRLFEVPRIVRLAPVDDLPKGEWQECNPGSVKNFSAVGYYFGRTIHKKLDVPIGLISSNWGGTNIETWTSREMSATVPEMREAIEGMDQLIADDLVKKMKKERQELISSFGKLEVGMKDGKPIWAAENLDLSSWKEMEVPGLWEDKGLKGLDGVVWFRRTFELTDEQAGGEAVLYLGKIDDSDKTWINGTLVGETMDQYDTDRVYTVDTGMLRPGENTIVVRIEDYRGGGGMYSGAEEMKLSTEGGTVQLAGVWKYRVSAADMSINIQNSISPNSRPTLLFNGMIHPITNYSIQGVIWYQGESNAGRAYAYRTRFPNLIKDWRNKWNNPDMGFYFVQLANYRDPQPKPLESNWAELREAQTMTLSLPKTGMAVSIDIGEADDIHPRNKQDVGKRLARAALHDTYGKEIVYSGPVLKEMTIEGSKVVLELDPIGRELVVKDKYGYVKGFAIAGEDRVFQWAKGYQDGNRIIISSKKVDAPVAVRYAWADNPDDANLYNSEGLPAGPFRTDDWPGMTFEE